MNRHSPGSKAAPVMLSSIIRIRGIRAEDKAWLKKDFDSFRIQPHLVDQGEGRGHGVEVSQAHKAYVVASVGVARVFCVPNELQLATGAQHLAFVTLDGHEVLTDEPVPLVGPGYSVAKERPAQVEKNLLFHRIGTV